MADADSSTNADTEERNLMYQNKNVVGSDGSDKSKDQKTLRRLAQNREAARKSRLRKKVYPSTFLNITNIFAPRYGGTKTRRLRKARLKTLILTDAALLKRQKKEIKELRAKLKVYYTAISSLYYSSLHNYIFTTIPIGASMYYSSLLTLVSVAIFSQHHIDGLDLSSNLLLYMMRCFPGVPQQKLRGHLGSFGITGNLALQLMYTL